MPVRLRCKCEAVLALHERYIGRKARCPECRWEFVVPKPPAGFQVVPTEAIQPYKPGMTLAAPHTRSSSISFDQFQQMLGDAGGQQPTLPEDQPVGEVGPQSAAALAPEKTATEIMVERAFNQPESEYERIKSLLLADPDAPHLYSQLGDVCLGLGRRDEAVEAYEKAMALDRSYDYLENKIEEVLGPQEYARRLSQGIGDAAAPDSAPAAPPSTDHPAAAPEEPMEVYLPLFSLKEILGYPLRERARSILIACSLISMGLWYGMNNVFNAGKSDADMAAALEINNIAVIALLALSLTYFMAFLVKSIHDSARGERILPDWPRLDEWWAEILKPILCLFFHFLICVVIPARLLSLLLPIPEGATELERNQVLTLRLTILLAMDFFYLPMASLVVAVAPGVGAINPLKVIAGMIKTFRHYIFALLSFGLSLGAIYLVYAVGSKALISFPLDFPAWLAFTFFALASTRALGVLYLTNRNKLGWDFAQGEEQTLPKQTGAPAPA